jgi:hypothetical protein
MYLLTIVAVGAGEGPRNGSGSGRRDRNSAQCNHGYFESMPKPAAETLLPGVLAGKPRRAVIIDGSREIRRARIRAALRDLFDFSALLLVDYLFVSWPRTHVPFLTRHDSLIILVSANALFLTWAVMARNLPRWRAQRIASTWSSNERTRFDQGVRQQRRP